MRKHSIIMACWVLFLFWTNSWNGLDIYAKTVTDEAGRTFQVPDDPQRVIALAPSITEIIFDLGQEHRLKGVAQLSNYPIAAQYIPQIGSYVHLDLEKIVALKPDLCIGIKDGNPKDAVARLESLGIPVYAVNPKTVHDVLNTILNIGQLLNSPYQALKRVKDLSDRIQHIKTLCSKTDVRPGVFFQIGMSPIVSVGSDTFIHEMIEIAGGRNLAQGDIPYPRFSKEQVISLKPDIIIICSMEQGYEFEKEKAEWKRWTQLPAVQNDRIFIVDSDIVNRPAPRLIVGLETLAKIIQPQMFK